MIKDIYTEAKKMNAEIDHHESDLYIIKNADTEKLIADYEFKQNVKTFRHVETGAIWYDIPFAYSPYWDAKIK